MKSKALFGMAMIMGAVLSSSGGVRQYNNRNIESEEDRKKRLSDAKISQNKAKGLKEFKYPGGTVWALNQKSADKKAKKLNF